MLTKTFYYMGNYSYIFRISLGIISIALLFLFFVSCGVNNNDDDNLPPCPPFLTVPTPPYDSPAWHPSGEFIGFNYTPLIKITYPYGEHCQGVYEWNSEMSGFWLINSDGTNMHRIFPYKLLNPVWSPDGEWIAFVMPVGDERHVFKRQFNGITFDTTTIVQLTSEGRNFFPSWSPDGQWIAYDNTSCGSLTEPPPPNSCGILIVKNDLTERRYLVKGRMPNWMSSGTHIIYAGLKNEIFQVNIEDTSQVIRLTGFNQVDQYSLDIRSPKYVLNGSYIAFWGNNNLWLMDSSGTNPTQILNQSIDYLYSVSPVGDKVVYTVYGNSWTYDNGTLWIVDLLSREKRQLTFNFKPNS